MTWKGIHPIVKLSRTVYQKGIGCGSFRARTPDYQAAIVSSSSCETEP
jgi:hypothetical protein